MDPGSITANCLPFQVFKAVYWVSRVSMFLDYFPQWIAIRHNRMQTKRAYFVPVFFPESLPNASQQTSGSQSFWEVSFILPPFVGLYEFLFWFKPLCLSVPHGWTTSYQPRDGHINIFCSLTLACLYRHPTKLITIGLAAIRYKLVLSLTHLFTGTCSAGVRINWTSCEIICVRINFNENNIYLSAL